MAAGANAGVPILDGALTQGRRDLPDRVKSRGSFLLDYALQDSTVVGVDDGMGP